MKRCINRLYLKSKTLSYEFAMSNNLTVCKL